MRELAHGLLALGLGPGDRLGIVAETCLEWTLLDIAAISTGVVTVPAYTTSTLDDLAHVLRDGEVRIVVAGDRAQADRVAAVRERAALARARGRDGGDAAAGRRDAAGPHRRHGRDARRLAPDGRRRRARSGAARRPDDAHLHVGHDRAAARLPPAAAQLRRHGAHRVRRAGDRAARRSRARLPAAGPHLRAPHAVRRDRGRHDDLLRHGPRPHPRGPRRHPAAPPSDRAARCWRRRTPACSSSSSPRAARAGGWDAGPSASASASRRSASSASPSRRASRCSTGWPSASSSTACRPASAARCAPSCPAARPWSPRSRGRCTRSTCSCWRATARRSAPPRARSTGRTATASAPSGRPCPTSSSASAEDGEIETRGPHVFDGYHNDPEATAAVLVDGWLRTGDVGEIDDDGYLRITDRKRDLITTTTGKNVAPQRVEGRLKARPGISQALVLGDRRPFLVALVTADESLAGRPADEVRAGRRGRGRRRQRDPRARGADPPLRGPGRRLHTGPR